MHTCHNSVSALAVNGFAYIELKLIETRKHSSRLRTAHLDTVCASVSVDTTRCQWREGGAGPPMSKFECVSSDHHQMSLAGGTLLCGLSHDAFDRYLPPLSGEQTDSFKTIPSRNFLSGRKQKEYSLCNWCNFNGIPMWIVTSWRFVFRFVVDLLTDRWR